MKFLADENIPQSFIRSLRSKGHDVLDSKKEFPEALDKKLVSVAKKEKRIIITYDKDFLDPVLTREDAGVIVFHLPKIRPASVLFLIDTVTEFIEKEKPAVPFRLVVQKYSITLQKEK